MKTMKRIAPGTVITCHGKGGEYLYLGEAKGAGLSSGEVIQVYGDEAAMQLYFRTSADFAERMALLNCDQCNGTRWHNGKPCPECALWV